MSFGLTLPACAVGAALVAVMSAAHAADPYPSRQVHIIVPTAPGGSTDALVRSLAKEMGERSRQAMVIENKTGANTIIAAEACAKAPPDGYTLCVLPNTTVALNPSLYSSLPYDAARSFAPITNLAVGQQVLVVHPSLPVKSFQELVEYSRAHPHKLNFASSGIGSNVHLTMETLWKETGADITHVPFKAASEAPLAFARGDIQVMYLIIGNAGVMDQIHAGKSRPLLVSGQARSPQLPEVPTFTEAGLDKKDSPTWFGLFAPAGTPADVIAKIHGNVWASLSNPAFGKRVLAPVGFQSEPNTPAQFATFLEGERERGGKMVQISGVRLDNKK